MAKCIFMLLSPQVGGTSGGVTSKDSREVALTRMLTVVCVIFTVCVLPFVIAALFRLVVPEYRPEGRYSNLMFATTAITHLFLSINSSINFLVYYNMSTRYKATLHAMLGCRSLLESASTMEKDRHGAGSRISGYSDGSATLATSVSTSFATSAGLYD
jgi:hypothetical protein